jgi:hypothetical protein
MAEPYLGLGALSWTGGDPNTRATLLLVGVPQDPAPAGSSVNFLYMDDTFYGSAELIGTGTISGGSITGTWQCNAKATPAYNNCSGSGTFSGTQQ